MTWFKVDDKFYSHRKVRDLSKGAKALWLMAGSYCADHLTDGLVCPSDIKWLGGNADEVRELIDAGLWDDDPEGYRFHDWMEYQPSKESRERDRERWRERKQKQRLNSKNDTSFNPSRPVRESRWDSRRDSGVTPPHLRDVKDVLAELDRRVGSDE